jgi:hypothetical protein
MIDDDADFDHVGAGIGEARAERKDRRVVGVRVDDIPPELTQRRDAPAVVAFRPGR